MRFFHTVMKKVGVCQKNVYYKRLSGYKNGVLSAVQMLLVELYQRFCIYICQCSPYSTFLVDIYLYLPNNELGNITDKEQG